MSLLNLNLTDVSADGPPLLAPGFYPILRITKTDIGRDDPKKLLWLAVSMVDGTDDENRAVHTERVFIDQTDNQRNWQIKRLLLACGREDMTHGEFDPQELVGLGFPGVIGTRDSTKDGTVRTFSSLKKIFLPEDVVPNEPETP